MPQLYSEKMRESLRSPFEELQFLWSCKFLQICFPAQRITLRFEFFRIFQDDRTTTARVARAGLQLVVRVQSFLQIIRRSNVERLIGTFEYVDKI